MSPQWPNKLRQTGGSSMTFMREVLITGNINDAIKKGDRGALYLMEEYGSTCFVSLEARGWPCDPVPEGNFWGWASENIKSVPIHLSLLKHLKRKDK